MALQQNNGGPVGYGQPNKGMRRRLMREEDERLFGSPESQDAQQFQGQGQPPQVYPQQPPGIPQGWQNQPGGYNSFADPRTAPQGGFQNQAMPGRTPLTPPPQYAGGQNQYANQAYGTPTNDPFTANLRNQMATPQGPDWMRILPDRNSGINGGFNDPGQLGQPQQMGGDIAAATRQSIQNNYTDIAGMRDVFKPGQFMGQLEGYNTNAWGTGERGSDTLKNMMGTIFSNHDVSQPGALQRALPDIRKALPDATIVQHANEDLIDPDGAGPMQPVDVIRGAVAGGSGAAWQWGPLDQAGPKMNGPQGPSNQMYNNAITQMTPQAGQPQGGMPQVQDENSAMDFLNWLMSQQQQGQLMTPQV